MRILLAASILVYAAILGAPAYATPVQMICTIDAPTTFPVAVWLPAGNICYVNGIMPIREVIPVVMMPLPPPILVPVVGFPHW
ncbi:MAG: hypothetical protein H0U99_07405 [Chthoniobacterales bacterium]|nr:hypothetical protein [Chthoniobacterales bacterium]